MRQIVLDTETTGINPKEGHRIIEIGCVELINRRLTNKHFHIYLNPEREIEAGALAVHGISNAFLQNKPKFKDIVDDFMSFTSGAELIIHNAPFDVGFINHELSLLNNEFRTIDTQCTIFDTLTFARQKHPGARNSLDALCKRYNIDNSHRELHGALLDAEILADVYLLMTGGQYSLLEDHNINNEAEYIPVKRFKSERADLRVIFTTQQELEEHQQRLDKIAKSSGFCLWQQ